MRKIILIITIIITALLFVRCADENPIEPAVKQKLTSLAKIKTTFTGNSTFVELHPDDNPTQKLLPNGKIKMSGRVSIYYEDVSDPRVRGNSIWYSSGMMDTDGTIKVKGKAKLILDGDLGEWEMHFYGTVFPDGSIIDYVTGTGKSGAVKGLVAKWIYNRPAGAAGYYDVEGSIFEKN